MRRLAVQSRSSTFVQIRISLRSLPLVIHEILLEQIIFQPAMLHQILSFFKQSLVLGLVYSQFLQCVIANLFELLFVLSINFLLNVLPVVISENIIFIFDYFVLAALVYFC